MAKTSDRYARWFGTRVPLVSRGATAIIAFLTAVPFSVVTYFLLTITFIAMNWLFVVLFSLLVGILIHIIFLLLLKIRFGNPSNNPEFNALVSQIYQKVALSSRTQVWLRRSEDAFIATSFTPLFNAIIVSEPMVDLILRTPESGEALLAFHFMKVPTSRWFGDLLGSIILFVSFTFTSFLLLIPLAISIGQYILLGYFYFIGTLLSTFASIFIFPIILIYLLKGVFWKHEPAFDGVQRIYGIHPNIAKVHVERGQPLDEDESNTVIWGVREWEKRRRGARRAGVSTLTAIGSFLLGYILLFWLFGGAFLPYFPYTYQLIYLPYILAIAGALISYQLLKRWDQNAMGEVFKKTTDYDEPIWID